LKIERNHRNNKNEQGVKNMTAVGIDTSFTGTGFAIKAEKGFIYKTIKTKPEDFVDDTDRICSSEMKYFKSIPVDTDSVYIEDVFVGHGPSAGASLRLALLAGCVRAGLRDKGIKFTIVQPTMVKKYISGKGNVPKDIIIKEVFKKFGIDTNDNNIADAICMASMSWTGYKIEPKVKKPKKAKKEVFE